MKLRYPIIALLMTAVIASCQQHQKPGAPIGPALQAAMDEALDNSSAIGVSAAVILPDGEMWAGAAGISHEGVPVTTDMLFDIASVQKNFQATLALTLVEEGLIALDDPLEKWLPSSPHIDCKITIRQLLNLTSGIDNFVHDSNSPWQVGYNNIDFDKIWTWEEIQADFIGEPSFEPGTKCEYSTTNYIVLKRIIEKATQSKQSVLLEDRLLKKNRLNHTLADFSKPVPENMRIAHGWVDTEGAGTADDISGNSLNWIASLSPMLVYSTPSDMVKWINALYHKKTVLNEETLKAMLDFSGPVLGEPLMKGYGLGVVDIDVGALMPRWERERVYGHLGSQFGYTTFVGYFPDYGVSMAIMFNRGCDRDTDRAVSTVSGAMIDVLLRHLGAKESKQQDSVSDMIKELESSPNDVHLMYRIAKQHQANKDDYEASLMYEEMLKRVCLLKTSSRKVKKPNQPPISLMIMCCIECGGLI